jgi:hypothetical protein
MKKLNNVGARFPRPIIYGRGGLAPALRKKAQMIVGYLLLFVIVVAALVVMGNYVRNSMSGKIRQAGDSFGGGAQYNPDSNSGYFHTGPAGETTTDTSGTP